jgi:Uma2 family endonuclease
MVADAAKVDSDLMYYPDSDGKPMADNTLQFRWIVVIKENLETLFAERPDVFVAGDLLWYPVEGSRKSAAPDTMVVFGRPKGYRGSYLQWKENNLAPQVVFEVLSPNNSASEMYQKQGFYEMHGVEEYYVYDPDEDLLFVMLRTNDHLQLADVQDEWVSPRLGIRFDLTGEEMQIFHPNGERFLTHQEITAERDAERAARAAAEQRATQAEAELEQLRTRLREMGIDPEGEQ